MRRCVSTCSPSHLQILATPPVSQAERIYFKDMALGRTGRMDQESLLILCRRYTVDWIILLGAIIIDIILQFVKPFHRYVNSEQLNAYKYPLKGNTVPAFALPIIGLLIPATVVVFFYHIRRDKRDLHQAFLGLLYAVVLTAVITDSVKLGVGWPRPDFFFRCFPDGVPVFAADGDVACTGKSSVVQEGHKSFPSGHVSWSFSGLMFLSYYLAGKLQILNGSTHISYALVPALPLIGATAVAITRVDDYWHRWQDVLIGALIGILVSTACYRLLYPSISDDAAGSPYISRVVVLRNEQEQSLTNIDVAQASPV